MKYLLILIISLITFFEGFGQEKYLIYFKDKGENDFAYFKKSQIEQKLFQSFSLKSIERRRKILGEEIFSYGDYPIYEPYLDTLKNLGIQIVNQLNWFNAVSCYLNEEQKNYISSLPFVTKVERVRVFKSKRFDLNRGEEGTLYKTSNNYGPSFNQLSLSDIPAVHSKGITGENVIIGLLDSGFRWKNHEAIQNTQVIAEYDFVFQDTVTSNEAGDHPAQDSHGTMILGIVAGKMDGKLYGASYNSKYILAKTEDIRSETRVEEDNYAAALEWMERLGVDVTSSSLGYSEFDDPNESYTYKDMNGQTTIVARAVDSAFVRGVVTVTAAGNEFNTPWKYIVSPADAKYVLAVGAVNPDGKIASFSSRGPTSDGRIKPDVCAQGTSVYTVQTGTLSSYTYASGTSASTPIVAGIAALLISHYPFINQYQVRDAIRWTASQADKPDTVYGWGIASAKRAIEFPVILKQLNDISLNKTFITDDRIDSVRLVVLTDYSNQIVYNDKMVSDISGIKFSAPSFHVFLNSDDVYKFYFYYYKNGQRFRDPSDTELYYSLHLNSMKVFPPRKSLNQVATFKLHQNYPNPFVDKTNFKFELPTQDWVTFEIYDVLGRKVKTLIKDVGLSRGIHNWLEWDGTDDNGNKVASGIYFYRINSLQFNQTKKMILLRK